MITNLTAFCDMVAWAERTPVFGDETRERAMILLIRECDALDDVRAGRLDKAINKCSRIWPSLHTRQADDLRKAYVMAGGILNNGGLP